MAVNPKGKQAAAKEDWTGKKFANNWVIEKKLSTTEYKKLYEEATGTSRNTTKNAYYKCRNLQCGIVTYLGRTTIENAIKGQSTCLSKCKGCKGNSESCYYSNPFRTKALHKVPERNKHNITPGQVISTWRVERVANSTETSDHQCHAICKCTLCGKDKNVRFDHLAELSIACDCFRSHSSGEILVKQSLDKLPLSYQSEYTFPDLVGTGGGALRYDYAIFDFNRKVIGLIEFDGQQHFQEAGTYFNPTGRVQEHDEIKNMYAHMHNIPLLRIPYHQAAQTEELLIDFIKKL